MSVNAKEYPLQKFTQVCSSGQDSSPKTSSLPGKVQTAADSGGEASSSLWGSAQHSTCSYLVKIQLKLVAIFSPNETRIYARDIFKPSKATSDGTSETGRQGREADRDPYTSPGSYT